MADLRVTSTGKVFYKVDDSTAALLIEALPSVFERAKAPAPTPPPTVPTFCLATGEQGRYGIRCNYPTGETRMLIPDNGSALPTREHAGLYFGNTVWDGTVWDSTKGTQGKHVHKSLPVPADIWNRFLAAYER